MIRSTAAALCLVATLALFPAALIAYAGVRWFPALAFPASISAGAMVVGPLPIAIVTFLSWQAAANDDRQMLKRAILFTFATVAIYALASLWGGRMLN